MSLENQMITTSTSESYVVSMIRDILASSADDSVKVQDLKLLTDNTNEYIQDYQELHGMLASKEPQMFHGIPGFHSIIPISKGGFGKVYQATHSIDAQVYAIKTIPMKFSATEIVTDALVSSLREARCLARLCHPNIVRYYNSWLDIGIATQKPVAGVSHSKSCDALVEHGYSKHILDLPTSSESSTGISRSRSVDSIVPVLPEGSRQIRTTLFIQTERMETNLREWIFYHKGGASYTTDVLEIMKQICNGVRYLHNMVPAIIHCDLKPENILLNTTEAGTWPMVVKVADFGLVTIADRNLRLAPDEGTSTYLAPELREDITGQVSAPSTKSDIYSLGIMFYELLDPSDTGMERSINIGKLKAGTLNTNTIIDRMVATDPDHRPSIHDTIRELNTVTLQKF